jgi:hypothetical protein
LKSCKTNLVVRFWKLNDLPRSIDTSPTDEDAQNPDLPLNRQIRKGTGIQYNWSKDVTEDPPMNIWMGAKQRSIRMADPLKVNTPPGQFISLPLI